ncbi:Rnf13 [Symbiodinium microadriaticum]|nr:Rnf13 [Symbiodinium microadriaticum]
MLPKPSIHAKAHGRHPLQKHTIMKMGSSNIGQLPILFQVFLRLGYVWPKARSPLRHCGTRSSAARMLCLSRKVFSLGCGRRRPSKTYRVTLKKQALEERFGIVITYTKRGEGLLIKDVGQESAVLQWTREHPDRPIRIGCAILAINGEDQIEPMLEQLHMSCKLDLLITAELTASQQQTLHRSLQKTVPSFVVESLPRVAADESAEKDVCAICFEELEGDGDVGSLPAQLPCGHLFHAPCVKTWLVTRSRRCPMCNQHVELKLQNASSPVQSGALSAQRLPEGAMQGDSRSNELGKPETFSHFVTEIRWALNSTKKDERALLASRIVRRALQSEHPTLVALLYKLDPEEFNSEDGVDKIVRFLEASPMNRQPLPDAGNKIGGYYRRLHKKPNEAIPAFLVRKDRVHDEMLKALQRLLRERERTFDDYEVDLGELKAFCGIPEGTSLYYGPAEGLDAEGDDQEQEREEADGSRRTSQPKGKDLLQRLMEQGFMPLAALDVIRGWMILEMSTSTEDERRIIKALLSMYEDRGSRRSRLFGFGHGARHAYWTEEVDPEAWYDEDGVVYYQDVEGAWWSDQWALYGGQEGEWVQEEVENEADEEPDSALVQLQDDQREFEKERQEIEAMLAENDRNLRDARRAVAAAVWWSCPTALQGGQQKGKVNFSEEAHFAKGPGKGKGKWSAPIWSKGGRNTKGGKGKAKGGNNFHLLTIDESDYCLAATEGASALGDLEAKRRVSKSGPASARLALVLDGGPNVWDAFAFASMAFSLATIAIMDLACFFSRLRSAAGGKVDPGDHGERQLPRTLCGAAGRPLDETVAARADRRRDEKRLHSIYAMAQEMASSQEVQTETLQGVSKETVEKAQKLLHRLHKAAGHPPNRGLATNLIYQACIDAKRGEQLVLPARFLLMIDLTMRFQAVELLWFSPRRGFKHRPRPEWVLCDPQTSLAYGLSRVGLAVTPGEAHWQLGGVEVAVKATKKTMKKIRSQEPNLRAAISGGTLGGNGCQPHAEGERAHYERDELVLDEPRLPHLGGPVPDTWEVDDEARLVIRHHNSFAKNFVDNFKQVEKADGPLAFEWKGKTMFGYTPPTPKRVLEPRQRSRGCGESMLACKEELRGHVVEVGPLAGEAGVGETGCLTATHAELLKKHLIAFMMDQMSTEGTPYYKAEWAAKAVDRKRKTKGSSESSEAKKKPKKAERKKAKKKDMPEICLFFEHPPLEGFVIVGFHDDLELDAISSRLKAGFRIAAMDMELDYDVAEGRKKQKKDKRAKGKSKDENVSYKKSKKSDRQAKKVKRVKTSKARRLMTKKEKQSKLCRADSFMKEQPSTGSPAPAVQSSPQCSCSAGGQRKPISASLSCTKSKTARKQEKKAARKEEKRNKRAEKSARKVEKAEAEKSEETPSKMPVRRKLDIAMENAGSIESVLLLEREYKALQRDPSHRPTFYFLIDKIISWSTFLTWTMLFKMQGSVWVGEVDSSSCDLDPALPFSSVHVDEYLESLQEQRCKPGAFTSFTEAVNFGVHVVGLPITRATNPNPFQRGSGANQILSPWARGAVALELQKKAERVQSAVLSTDAVVYLENFLADAGQDIVDRYAAGCLLFAVFSRSRISDLRKSTTLSWCSKFGMDKHTRLQLGHRATGDGALNTYGRDFLAPALRKYAFPEA